MRERGEGGGALRYASRGGFAPEGEAAERLLRSRPLRSRAAERKSGGGGGGGGGGGSPSVAVGAKRGRDAAAADDGRPAPERGCVLKFEGVGADATREAIAALAAKHGDVAFTEFWPGKTDGYVRYKAAASATAALAAITTEDVGGAVPTWRLLAPEEEATAPGTSSGAAAAAAVAAGVAVGVEVDDGRARFG